MDDYTYVINGVPIDNPLQGWILMRSGTQALSGITKRLTSVTVPGFDGYFRAPATRTEQVLIFNVKSTLGGLQSLLSLLDSPLLSVQKSDDMTREAPAELVSAIPSGEFPGDDRVYLTVTLNVFGAAWRDTASTTTGPVTIGSPIQDINLLDGLSAPVRDMDLFLSGVFGQFTLKDSNGSWIKSTAAWPGSASTGLLYVGSTGQFFRANTASPWTPIADVGNLVDVSGGGGFKITPEIVGGDPSVRRGRVTLTTLSQTGVTLRVRAKGAYSMQYGG